MKIIKAPKGFKTTVIFEAGYTNATGSSWVACATAKTLDRAKEKLANQLRLMNYDIDQLGKYVERQAFIYGEYKGD